MNTNPITQRPRGGGCSPTPPHSSAAARQPSALEPGRPVRTVMGTLTKPDERRNVFQIYQGTRGLLLELEADWALVKFDGYINPMRVPRQTVERDEESSQKSEVRPARRLAGGSQKEVA